MTEGENGFGPPGSMRGAFSVGSAAGAVVVVVVVVVVVSGAFSSSFAHAAESPTKAMIAAAPAMAGMRRVERRVVMFFLSVPRLGIGTADSAIHHWKLYPISEQFLGLLSRRRIAAESARRLRRLTVSVAGCLLVVSNIFSNEL